MTGAKTSNIMSTKLLKVAERAKREPQTRLLALAHLVDQGALKWAFDRLRKDAAVGVDGVTKEEFAQGLEARLEDLHGRLKAGKYRHQPIRRVHIPKAAGKTRPIGVSTVEDKIVQTALTKVLEAIYEQDFLTHSYGFRPGRNAHDALRALHEARRHGECNWLLEADIQTYFDSLDRTRLQEMLRLRIADESFMRLIGKCLHVGVLDGTDYSEPDEGTVQGSVLSPMLGNIYLHHVLDLWFEHDVRPRMRGKTCLVRYCDDFVIGFERQDDAERVMRVIAKRMAKYKLSLHPTKTRLVCHSRPNEVTTAGTTPESFDFLGFTHHWRRSRQSRWVPGLKTRKAGLKKAFAGLTEWCRSHRHYSVKEQHAGLCLRLRGHYAYFGVNGNTRSLRQLHWQAGRIWRKWLGRRSQRATMTWERFNALLKNYPLPPPRVTVRIWVASP
jgi:group II intron reverse transcriptase/maturase